MNCPVCDTHLHDLRCPGCGFDGSRDYERFPTFGVVHGAVSAAGLRSRRTPKDALLCKNCGSAAFTIRIPDGTPQCRSCGWSPEPEPRLSCSCGGTLFIVRMTDGALVCPLCGGTVSLETLNGWFSGTAQKTRPAPFQNRVPYSSEVVPF